MLGIPCKLLSYVYMHPHTDHDVYINMYTIAICYVHTIPLNAYCSSHNSKSQLYNHTSHTTNSIYIIIPNTLTQANTGIHTYIIRIYNILYYVHTLIPHTQKSSPMGNHTCSHHIIYHVYTLHTPPSNPWPGIYMCMCSTAECTQLADLPCYL